MGVLGSAARSDTTSTCVSARVDLRSGLIRHSPSQPASVRVTVVVHFTGYLTCFFISAWARHEPPSPDRELPANPIHPFLGTGNIVHQNESQQHLSINPGSNISASSQTSSFRGERPSDVASMTSSAPDQMSEPQQGQATWWPFSLPSVPIPLRKNSGQQGQGSSLTSPFQSLFAQTQWLIPTRAPEEKSEGLETGQPNGSAGGAVTGGDDEEAARARPKPVKDRPRVQWLFDRAQVRKQGWLTEEEMRQQPPRKQTGDTEGQDNDIYVDDDEDHEEAEDENGNRIRRRLKRFDLQINIPRRGKGPFTVSNSKTPGWEQPWTPTAPPRARLRGQDGKEGPNAQGVSLDENENDAYSDTIKALSKKQQRTQTFRTWILQNNAVPLVCLYAHRICLSTKLLF